MKNLIFLLLTLLLLCNSTKAQTLESPQMSKSNLYLELGTILLVNSVTANFETHLSSSASGKSHLYGRAGVGAVAIYFGSTGPIALGALTWLTGTGKHHFEISGGVFIGADNEVGGESFILPLLDFGYRLQKPGKGFVFRAKAGVLGIGVGLGYAF